jgi:hypothetical protein
MNSGTRAQLFADDHVRVILVSLELERHHDQSVAELIFANVLELDLRTRMIPICMLEY